MIFFAIKKTDIEENQKAKERWAEVESRKEDAIKEGLKFRPELRKAYENLRLTRIDGTQIERDEAHMKYMDIAMKRYQAEKEWEDMYKRATNEYQLSLKGYGQAFRKRVTQLIEEIKKGKFYTLVKKERNLTSDQVTVTYKSNNRLIQQAVAKLTEYAKFSGTDLAELQQKADEMDEFLSSLDFANGEVLSTSEYVWQEIMTEMSVMTSTMNTTTRGYMGADGKMHDMSTGQLLEI